MIYSWKEWEIKLTLNRLSEFDYVIENFNITPFFQSKKDNRIRFGTKVFEGGNTKTLKSITDYLFDRNEEIESTFIIGYGSIETNKIRYGKFRYNRVGLSRFFKIKNWKESLIKSDDLESIVVFATVKGLNKNVVFNYCKSVILGGPSAYIMFYNDSFLLYVSTDVIDIISKEKDNIVLLKKDYYEIYDKYHK